MTHEGWLYFIVCNDGSERGPFASYASACRDFRGPEKGERIDSRPIIEPADNHAAVRPAMSGDPLNPSVSQAMNALADAVKALNPTRDDLSVMATNTGIMVFYDKNKGFPALPSCGAYTRDQ